MNFSTNQVRQFYVANAEGDLFVKDNGGFRYLELKNGGRSDLMEPSKITHIEHTLAEKLQVFNRQGMIALAEGVTPEVGKTYTFKIYIHDLYGAGDEYIQPIVASVEAKTTAAEDLYKDLVKSLDPKAETKKHNESGINVTTGKIKGYHLIIEGAGEQGIAIISDLKEANEGWSNAINPLKEIKFDICVDTEVWVKPVYFKGNEGFASGYKLAELEYFCMGERGDQYRMMGYPNHIVTKYNIVPTENYDVIDIMYYHTDNKEGVQRSEKVITIAAPNTVAKELLTALKGTAEDTPEDTPGVNTDKDFLDEE